MDIEFIPMKEHLDALSAAYAACNVQYAEGYFPTALYTMLPDYLQSEIKELIRRELAARLFNVANTYYTQIALYAYGNLNYVVRGKNRTAKFAFAIDKREGIVEVITEMLVEKKVDRRFVLVPGPDSTVYVTFLHST